MNPQAGGRLTLFLTSIFHQAFFSPLPARAANHSPSSFPHVGSPNIWRKKSTAACDFCIFRSKKNSRSAEGFYSWLNRPSIHQLKQAQTAEQKVGNGTQHAVPQPGHSGQAEIRGDPVSFSFSFSRSFFWGGPVADCSRQTSFSFAFIQPWAYSSALLAIAEPTSKCYPIGTKLLERQEQVVKSQGLAWDGLRSFIHTGAGERICTRFRSIERLLSGSDRPKENPN